MKGDRAVASIALLFCFVLFGSYKSNGNAEQLPRRISLPVGIWVSSERLTKCPTSGSAWNRLKKAASEPVSFLALDKQHSRANVQIMAKALVYAKTGEERYRKEVVSACMMIIGTERGGTALALGKQLIAYVLAADLVGLPEEEKLRFRGWLRDCLSYRFKSGKTLRSTHEHRPNNWGTLAGASRLTVAVYLEDMEEVKNCAKIFEGWLGNRSIYADFKYKDCSWQAKPLSPVGINPKGAIKNGHSIDGVLPDDQRRCGSFQWPPPKNNYVYTALQGAVAQAVILSRCGYPVWNWEDKALLRAFKWLYDVAEYLAEGNDMWMLFVINHAYDESFPAPFPDKPGKNVAWTDWTHGNHLENTLP